MSGWRRVIRIGPRWRLVIGLCPSPNRQPSSQATTKPVLVEGDTFWGRSLPGRTRDPSGCMIWTKQAGRAFDDPLNAQVDCPVGRLSADFL